MTDQPHNPGGKVETALPPGMTGDAQFYGGQQQYRLWLSRYWDGANMATPYVLWIGMNPSTARHDVNDPTITREISFTKDWGFRHYVKCNVLDYRATKQSDLLKESVRPRSDRNLETIINAAERADRIILCYGVMHKSLQHYADATVNALRHQGHVARMFCLGRSLDGYPRHPLYLKADTKLELLGAITP